MIVTVFLCVESINGQEIFRNDNAQLLANGKAFVSWEKPPQYSKTYYVDGQSLLASDENTGTAEQPFRTINKAAQIVKAGERVVIREGVYRESIHPLNGGTSADKMIYYEAEKNQTVIIKGSIITSKERWKKSNGFNFPAPSYSIKDTSNVWQYSFNGNEFNGYNPFGMLNLMHDRSWLQYKKEVNMTPHFMRRGMLFANGIPAKQVLHTKELRKAVKDTISFWVEHNGMRIHVNFPNGKNPSDYEIEISNKEQIFVPSEYGLNYIQLKDITFMHASNGFPVPQRGMVSANRGHHWIIENCIIDGANSVGIDLGIEIWDADSPRNGVLGHCIIRKNIFRNCGISGLQGMGCVDMLIEDNIFENIGWQDAELGFESGAIKLHNSDNTLIRRNMFRYISYAPGIWLDYLSNENCRITRNIFTNIITARGAIYIEVSHRDCRVDHNIFNKINSRYWLNGDYGAGGSALYTDGSDSIRFDHNLVFDVENSGFGCYQNADRLVDGRGGITRWHKVSNNIFVDCRKEAIEFPNEFNFCDGNIFSKVPSGYIKIANPAPAMLWDIDAVRKVYGWERNGKMIADIMFNLDPQAMTLNIIVPNGFTTSAGPFIEYKNLTKLNIDPRK